MKLRLLIAAVLAATCLVLPTASVDAAPTWAPAATATIHPGVQTNSPSGQCTSNFIFTNGTEVLIGQAAHCTGTGGATETDGCLAGSLPLGTQVEIDGASRPGTMVYNSWLAMQAAGETDPDVCAYNDFALIRIDPADVGSVNPSIPHWGGPTGVNTTGAPATSDLYSYGNSSLRLGLTVLSPKRAVSLGTTGSGWTHPHYAVSPGIPGDSGSAFLDAQGRAIGVLSTLAVAPLPASNNASDVHRSLNYARAHGLPGVTLELGTEAFNPNRVPLGV